MRENMFVPTGAGGTLRAGARRKSLGEREVGRAASAGPAAYRGVGSRAR